jgi:hypothetical protein
MAGAAPVVSGGVPLGTAGLKLTWKHSSGNLWQVTLPATINGNPIQPFESLFYNGSRRLRSRLQSSSSTSVGYYMNGGACYSTQTNQTVDRSNCNLGTFLRIAGTIAPTDSLGTNCPSVTNSADSSQSKCLDRFKYNPADAIPAFSNLNPTTLSSQRCPLSSGGNTYPQGDVEVTLFDAWSVDVLRMSCVDTARQVIYFTGPAKSMHSPYDAFGPSVGHRYIIENSLDAFIQAQTTEHLETGLWFLDRSNSSAWVLNYLANPGENPQTDNVVIPQVQPIAVAGGSLISATNLKNVTFHGITFEMDSYVPPALGFNNDDNGESGLPEAIDCESCQNVTFDGVTLRHTNASGILFASTSSNSGPPASNDVIQNSSFYDIGDSGVRIGHHYNGRDKAANVVQYVTVQNNLIRGYSRVFADGEGIAQGNGHDMLYQYNDINDGYHAGISVCNAGCAAHEANAFNIVSQFNHIWDVMQGITSDGGALYYGIGGWDGSGTGNKILNNLVHDTTDSSIIDGNQKYPGTGYGGQGIYVDNQSGGVDVENNVVYRVSHSPLWMTQGPPAGTPGDTFNNNILAYGRSAMFDESGPWTEGCYTAAKPLASVTNNIFYFDLDDTAQFYVIRGCAYACTYNSYTGFQNFQGNLYWRTDGGFSTYGKAFHANINAPGNASRCIAMPRQWTFLDFSQWQSSSPPPGSNWGPPGGMNEDIAGMVNTNPIFGATGDKTDFLLPAGSTVGNLVADKTNLTINTAGRRNPALTPSGAPGVVAATFPTYSYTTTQVTVGVQPGGAGLEVMWNGKAYRNSQVLHVPEGNHTLSVATPQSAGGAQYVFQSWSDGNTNPSRTIAVGPDALKYRAIFVRRGGQ